MSIRAYRDEDFSWLLEFNNSCVPEVGQLNAEQLEALIQLADRIRVFELNGIAVAALITLVPNSNYQSSNYKWFDKNFQNYLYVDRIMVSSAARGAGVGKALYLDLQQQAVEEQRQHIFCEVNELPPNPKSMAFHQKIGFSPLESRVDPASQKTVCMLSWAL